MTVKEFLYTTATILKKELFFFMVDTGILSKRYIINVKNLPKLYCDVTNIEEQTHSTNNMLFVHVKEKKYFFRICKKHGTFSSFVTAFIENFVQNNSSVLSSCEIDILKKSYKSRKHLIKLYYIGVKNNYYSLYRLALRLNSPRLIGLDCVQFTPSLILFAHQIWSEVYSYRLNWFPNRYQVFNLTHSLCEEAVCKLLCPNESLLCSNEVMRLIIGEKTIIGSLQEKAQGVNVDDLSTEEIRTLVSPHLQRVLNILNVLDAICNEKDHRPNNYNIVLDDDGKGRSIQVFDNDSPFAFFPTFSSKFHSYFGTVPLVSHRGIIRLSFLDKDFVLRIMDIGKKDIINTCRPYLNFIQCLATYYRFKRIKKAIIKTMHERTDFLSDKNHIDIDLYNDEISGKYGRTYLYLLYHWASISEDYEKKHCVNSERF